ncbi:MAG: hypothetical protein QOG11_1677 [Solirubrobacteraceae bacterium]|jgi:hypothetical protein|nr:hypothetical protein [Solirubrobacteraceae bacterium]
MATVSATTAAATPATDTVVVAKQGTASAGQSPSFTDDLAAAAEQLQPVKDHAFSKVVAGAREGQYVNRSHNERHGEAFAVVRRAGRVFHVYGSGDDRKVVELPSAAKAAAEAKAKADTSAGSTADTTATGGAAAGGQ